jgi:hypothetical protein
MQISSTSILKFLALFQVCLNRRDEVQAMKCLAKAVQADPTNLQMRAAPKKVGWESADEDSDDEELEFGASAIELQD